MVHPDLSLPPTHREALVNGFVYVHQTLHQANTRLAKRGGHTMAITPRHYLDFINHYVRGGEGGLERGRGRKGGRIRGGMKESNYM